MYHFPASRTHFCNVAFTAKLGSLIAILIVDFAIHFSSNNYSRVAFSKKAYQYHQHIGYKFLLLNGLL